MSPNLNDVYKLLGEMDAKLDRVVLDANDHEGRINKLERHRWFQAGIVASVSAGAAFVWSIFKG